MVRVLRRATWAYQYTWYGRGLHNHGIRLGVSYQRGSQAVSRLCVSLTHQSSTPNGRKSVEASTRTCIALIPRGAPSKRRLHFGQCHPPTSRSMHNGASFGKRNVQVFWWDFACWRLLIQISWWHPGLSQNHGRSGVYVRRVESE